MEAPILLDEHRAGARRQGRYAPPAGRIPAASRPGDSARPSCRQTGISKQRWPPFVNAFEPGFPILMNAETKLVNAVVTARSEGMTASSKALDTALGFLWIYPPTCLRLKWSSNPMARLHSIGMRADRVLSISVSGVGTIGYAGLIGLEPVCGRAPFAGAIPETVLCLLTRLYPSDAPTDFR